MRLRDSGRLRPPPGTRQLLKKLGPSEFAAVGAQGKAAAADGHDVSRCAPVAAGHARSHVRSAGDRRRRRASPAESFQPGNVGRRDVRHFHAFSARRSLAAPAGAARADSQYLLPDAAARRQRGRLHVVSGQRDHGIRSRSVMRRASISSAIFDSLNSIENMRVSIDAVLETGAVCEAAICYTGDILDPARPKYSLKYYVRDGQAAGKTWRAFSGIKDMAGLCKPYAAFHAGEGAARGNRHSRSISTRTTPAASMRLLF